MWYQAGERWKSERVGSILSTKTLAERAGIGGDGDGA
jgi:hypothetical protein